MVTKRTVITDEPDLEGDPIPPAELEPDPDALVIPPEPKKVEPAKTFTAEDIEKVRKEEKDKLYADLEKERQARGELDARIAVFEKERIDQQKATDKATREEAARIKALEEEEMSVRELLSTKEQEWETRFATADQERAALAATLDMERQYQALQQYKAQRMDEEAADLMPDLLDLIGGNSQEEVDASIDMVRQKTASILSQVQAVQQQTRQQTRTVAPTGAPPIGPMEQEQSFETLTPQQIKDMPMSEYAKNRDRIMQGLSAHRQQRGGNY